MRPRLAILVATLLAACAHRTWIETNPTGASIYVDDRFVCISPCLYETSATQLRDHTPVRIERAGYDPLRSELQTEIRSSRIVRGLFTLGLVPLFKWPHTYRSRHRFNLRPLSREERLDKLERDREAGAITQEEYQRLRLGILATQ